MPRCAPPPATQSLADLVRPVLGGDSGFLSPELGADPLVKHGYVFTVTPGSGATTVTPASKTCNGAAADAVSSYFAEAHPVKPGVTGQRSFATHEYGIIYYNDTGQIIRPGMAGTSPMQ